ncbi:LysR family transcriptional regulator [Siccibacter turicensis]|uniref:LysR family transcriptional regulator n=1 Tax=Siccibacter turicensis TaxID=357233 RepID=A0A2P8VRV4_9ENTR|nr:LysR family transcriptional regulator [Siccibacter turicensis]PSN09798.1 LysR family transcriptional regulator [Siccibacter turicensis]
MKRQERIDRLELMMTFVRIVESGSLSAAALLLGTTQATVSRRLQTLETLLGAKLLLRSTHAMKLTDDGERCFHHSQALLAGWQNLEDELKNADEEPVGVLRVRAPHAFGQEQLLVPLTEFLMAHSKLSVEWMLNDKSVDFLAENIDCAIQVGTETDPANVSVLLAEVPRIVIASPELLARYPEVKEVKDLAALPWVALSTFYQHEVTLTHAATAEVYRLPIAPRLSSDSLYAVKGAALTGLGAAVVSAWVVRDELEQGRLVNLLPDWQADMLPVRLVYPHARYQPARLCKFLALMREVMPGLSGVQAPKKSRP